MPRWIKAHAALFAPEHWLRTPARRYAFLDLIFRASYTDGGLDGRLRRGQVGLRYAELARAWGWDRKTVRSFIGELEGRGAVRLEQPGTPGANSLAILTICNYGTYQANRDIRLAESYKEMRQKELLKTEGQARPCAVRRRRPAALEAGRQAPNRDQSQEAQMSLLPQNPKVGRDLEIDEHGRFQPKGTIARKRAAAKRLEDRFPRRPQDEAAQPRLPVDADARAT